MRMLMACILPMDILRYVIQTLEVLEEADARLLQWGVIEDYVVNPGNEQLMAEANFFKDLRKTPPLQSKK